MTRYRDKETGEVVEVTPITSWVAPVRFPGGIVLRVKFSDQDFRARFEPVEGGDAEPRPRP